MTYCVGLRIKAGLVLLSDTRTNAGVDNIARFRKMFVYQKPGERVIAIMTAGNLSVTQGVITHIETALKDDEVRPDEVETILNCSSTYRAAELIGETLQEVGNSIREGIESQGVSASATLIVAGQRKGGDLRLFKVYSAGNFIESSDDTPFFQIGEHKYGKPILDRVIQPDTTLDEAIKAAIVSMDSTLRSNLSVGMPLDLAVIKAGEFKTSLETRIDQDHPEFREISDSWASALREAFHSLPTIKA